MSDRTITQVAAVDSVMLFTRGSVQRELLSADRKRWHKALRTYAQEAGRQIECGNHGRTAWAVLGYQIGERRPAAVAFRD